MSYARFVMSAIPPSHSVRGGGLRDCSCRARFLSIRHGWVASNGSSGAGSINSVYALCAGRCRVVREASP